MTMAAPTPAPRGRGRPHRNPHSITNETQKNEVVVVSEYEQSREERIKQNLQKMQKLGIFDLSLKLKSCLKTPKNSSYSIINKTPPSISPPLQPSGPIRRSSRLKTSTPVSYSEVDLAKKDKELGFDENVLAEAGSKPEIYTEEHEKLLGNTEKSWTLFVDGYGSDGKRIYDSVKGKTCHQCRQKTLGYRTHCSSCNMVQGQFCGDCLYMRYGEHVHEALENPDWICPVCRGICNCSLCRQAKGWAPTGTLYKKITRLGFKSVAHYLIQTHQAHTKLGNSRETTNEVSVKRSMPFSDMNALPEDSLEVANDHPRSPELFTDQTNDESKNNCVNQNSAKRSLPFSDMRQDSENIGSLEADHKVDDLLGSSKHQHQNEKDNTCQSKKDKELHEIQYGNGEIVLKNIADQVTESRMESIADNDTPMVKVTSTAIIVDNHDDVLLDVDEKISDVKQAVDGASLENKVDEEKEVLPSDVEHHGDVSTPLERSSKLKRKHVQPSFDSIGGRVRQRRQTSHSHGDELQGPQERENSDLKQAAKQILESTSSQPSSESIAGRLRSRRKST